MTDTFKQSDTFRQGIEKNASAIKEAQNKVVRDCENKFVNQLLETYGNGKLVSESGVNLQKMDIGTTAAHTFEGNVVLHAQVTDEEGKKFIDVEVPVSESAANLLDTDDLKDIVSKSEVANPTEEIDASVEVDTLKADLGKFSVVDDGSDYLKIYHSAFDTGRELTQIHKQEYSGYMTKEALFKEALENQVTRGGVDNHFKLEFEGSFVEPNIEVRHSDNIVTASDYKENTIEKEASKEEEVQEETSEENADSSDVLARKPDYYTRSLESERQQSEARQTRFLRRVANDLYKHLVNMRFSNVDIGTITPSLDAEINGSISVSASFKDSEGSRNVEIPLTVNAGSYKLPKKEALDEILSTASTFEDEVQNQLNEEIHEKMNSIDEFEEWNAKQTEAALEGKDIEKKAAAHSDNIQDLGPTTVLKVEKHLTGLDEETPLGTRIYANGHHWELTDKEDGQLSKEKDSGSIWTFTKVQPGKEKPEHTLDH